MKITRNEQVKRGDTIYVWWGMRPKDAKLWEIKVQRGAKAGMVKLRARTIDGEPYEVDLTNSDYDWYTTAAEAVIHAEMRTTIPSRP